MHWVLVYGFDGSSRFRAAERKTTSVNAKNADGNQVWTKQHLVGKETFYFRGGFIIKFKDSKMETNKNNIILDIQKVKEYNNYQLYLNNY